MTAMLDIGCGITQSEIIDNLINNKFSEKYPNVINPDINLYDENINEIIYTNINNFFKLSKLPFRFYTPYIPGDPHNMTVYYLSYSSDDKSLHHIDFNFLIENNEKIKQDYKKTLELLFGGASLDKYKLTIYSNFSY